MPDQQQPLDRDTQDTTLGPLALVRFISNWFKDNPTGVAILNIADALPASRASGRC
jgi:hypothetical protein